MNWPFFKCSKATQDQWRLCWMEQPWNVKVLLDSASPDNHHSCSEAKIINKSLLSPIYYFKNLLFKIQGIQKGIKEKASLSTPGHPVLSHPVSFPRGNNNESQVRAFHFNNILHMCKHRYIHHFLYPFNINHNIHIVLHLDF